MCGRPWSKRKPPFGGDERSGVDDRDHAVAQFGPVGDGDEGPLDPRFLVVGAHGHERGTGLVRPVDSETLGLTVDVTVSHGDSEACGAHRSDEGAELLGTGPSVLGLGLFALDLDAAVAEPVEDGVDLLPTCEVGDDPRGGVVEPPDVQQLGNVVAAVEDRSAHGGHWGGVLRGSGDDDGVRSGVEVAHGNSFLDHWGPRCADDSDTFTIHPKESPTPEGAGLGLSRLTPRSRRR